jgi:small subunit ribosomal protein S30e
MDMEEIVLSFNGTPLNDEQTVEQFGLTAGSILDATVKLFGGKVHGSLARAGKVKGQTPKVETKEHSLSNDGLTMLFFRSLAF